MARIVDVDAFLLGMKPAYYGNKGCPTTMKHMDKLKSYPYVTEDIAISDNDYFLFFQNDELKSDFLDKVKNVTPRSPEFHELLGVTIGYPPAAARFFARCQRNENLYVFSLAIHYAGIRCISHVDDLKENAKWLWDRYTEQENMKILIGGTTFHSVEGYDLERLHEIQMVHKQKEAAAV